MNILEEIVAAKRVAVQKKKLELPIRELERSPFFKRQSYSLANFLLDQSHTGIIAEFKRKSPSKGNINLHADVAETTAGFANGGASALSILTDTEYFGGSPDDLRNARFNQIPILRKDFMIDEYQIVESKAIGADAILLIAACLTQNEARDLAKFALGLGLEVLLEIHEESELRHICDHTRIVGINNRNLKTFAVDIDRSLAMADKISVDRVKVAESGIHSVENILLFKRHGFSGFLIGENFMKSPSPAIAFASFVNNLKTVST